MPRALAVLVLASLAACGPGGERRVSALLITLDTTNPEALSCYGGAAATANLDRLAAEGIVFENARTVAPLTLPAHASMLTGLVPLRHSVRRNGDTVLPESATTLAERARGAGYRTAAFVAAVVLDPNFGLDQGFELYDAPPTPEDVEEHLGASRSAREIVDRALEWLEDEREQPFFLWLHFYDPHFPYDPPEECRTRAGGDRYLGEVLAVDDEIGRLVRALEEEGRLERTCVVVAADHGEGHGRHGEETHGAFVFDSTLRVPLIVRPAGGGGAGTRSQALASVVDVYPTLVRALGLGEPGEVDGRDLLAPPAERAVDFESCFGVVSFGWSALTGVADARGKYVHSSAPEYFDLGADPLETRSVLEERAADVERARTHMRELAALPRLPLTPLEEEDRNLAQEIERLGYAGCDDVSDGYPEPLESSSRPSPHRMIRAYADYMQARKLMEEEGSLTHASDLLRSCLAANPENHKAWFFLGLVLRDLGQRAEAIEAFRRVLLAPGGERISAELNLGVCLYNAGQLDLALEHVAHALEDTTGPPGALDLYVRLLEESGRVQEAERQRARACEPASSDP